MVRLTRLADAADEAVSGDARALRRNLHRFEALTFVIWAVQHAVYGQAPLPRDAPAGRARHSAESPSWGPGARQPGW